MLDIFDKIKLELGENFKTGDDTVLANIVDETITDALSISKFVYQIEKIPRKIFNYYQAIFQNVRFQNI